MAMLLSLNRLPSNLTCIIITLSALLLVLSGCAKVCTGGVGEIAVPLYGLACMPYEMAQDVKSVHGDLQPGGMLNPHSNKAGISNSSGAGVANTPTLSLK